VSDSIDSHAKEGVLAIGVPDCMFVSRAEQSLLGVVLAYPSFPLLLFPIPTVVAAWRPIITIFAATISEERSGRIMRLLSY